MSTFTFDIQKEDRFDVVVAGCGSSGFAAAVAAARQGAKVAVIERNGSIGGTPVCSLVGPFMTCYTPDGKRQVVKGIFDEVVSRMEKRGGAIHPSKTGAISSYGCYIPHRHNNVTPYNPGFMEIVMAEMLKEEGIKVFLNNVIVDAEKDEQDAVVAAITYDGSKFRRFRADAFVDATGDAVLAEKSGVRCVQGTPDDPCEVQPVTLFFWIYNADDGKIEQYLDMNPKMKYQPYNAIIEADRAQGKFNIPRSKIGLYHMVNNGEWRLNTTRIQGCNPSDPDSLSEAYLQGLEQVDFLFDYFKKCPGLENARLGQIGTMMGIRESKRIIGAYVLKKEDMIGAVEFDDTVALCSYPVDMHPSKGNVVGLSNPNDRAVDDVYPIPYRSLLPKKTDNLLVAGRCVSATREALAAIRIMPVAMATGEAAGVAAAIASQKAVTPREVNITELRTALRESGAVVDL